MVRAVASESVMQEVIKLAGKKLLVVHFFDTFGPDFREELEKIAQDDAKEYEGGSFVLVEINKYVDPKVDKGNPEKVEWEKSTEELKEKYLPGYTAGVGTPQPMLVFFQEGKIVRFKALK